MQTISEISNLKISSSIPRVTSRLLTLACPSMWSTKPRAYAGPLSMLPLRFSSTPSQGNIGPSTNSAFMNLIRMYLTFHIPACQLSLMLSLLSCESPSLQHKNYLARTMKDRVSPKLLNKKKSANSTYAQFSSHFYDILVIPFCAWLWQGIFSRPIFLVSASYCLNTRPGHILIGWEWRWWILSRAGPGAGLGPLTFHKDNCLS